MSSLKNSLEDNLNPDYSPSILSVDFYQPNHQELLDGEEVEEQPLQQLQQPPKQKKVFLPRTRGEQLPCIVCPKIYYCKKFLQRHKTFHHHLCKQVQQLDCEHCGAIFADVQSHKKHLEETDNHLKEFFSVGLPQKIKQQQRAEDLNNLRKKTQLLNEKDQIELEDFFLRNQEDPNQDEPIKKIKLSPPSENN